MAEGSRHSLAVILTQAREERLACHLARLDQRAGLIVEPTTVEFPTLGNCLDRVRRSELRIVRWFRHRRRTDRRAMRLHDPFRAAKVTLLGLR